VLEPVDDGTRSEGGGTPSQLPDTGAGSGVMLLALALAITSMLAGIRLRRRGHET
jgi:LPXTG-motif cell wall-anchored protein